MSTPTDLPRITLDLLLAMGFRREGRHLEVQGWPTHYLITPAGLRVAVQERGNAGVFGVQAGEGSFRPTLNIADVFEAIRDAGRLEKASEIRRALNVSDR
jgi:hypothetical protein